MTPPFERFGPPHLAVIALTFATPLFLAAVVRWSDSAAVARAASWFLVGLLVGAKTLMLVFLARDGELTFGNAAPTYLCDWAAVATVITLIYPNQMTYELGYFWALAGTLQALLTPDLSYEFPDPRFVSFFCAAQRGHRFSALSDPGHRDAARADVDPPRARMVGGLSCRDNGRKRDLRHELQLSPSEAGAWFVTRLHGAVAVLHRAAGPARDPVLPRLLSAILHH